MQRREVLRILATGTALQLAPRSVLAMLVRARKELTGQSSGRSLNAHQESTVKVMAELILPRTDTPGAADVGATEFIDLMLTEWFDERERSLFLGGLDDVDARSKTLFGKDFVECSPVQQSSILMALGEKMLEETTPNPLPFASGPPYENFYATLRRLTLTAYYTSEAGATDELHFEIIPERHSGCETISSAKDTVQK
jgi:hypothetical protein